MAFENAKLRISIHLDNGQVTDYYLTTKDRWIIGKDRNCNLVLDASGVSRKHCRLEFEEGQWIITDLMSSNGTVVNGVKLKASGEEKMGRLTVRSGDVLLVGTARIYLGGINDSEVTSILPAVPTMRANPPDTLEPIIRTASQIDDEGSIESIAPFKETQIHNSRDFTLQGRVENFPDTEAPEESLAIQNASALWDEGKQRVAFPFDWNGYRFIKRIGAGATGRVYLAESLDAEGLSLAVKVINPLISQNLTERKRFMREIEINRLLSHSTIVAFKECGEFSNTIYIVMEYCNAGNLSQFLLRGNRLNARRTIRLLDRLLVALGFAHSKGIVHRDLKPSNILLHKLPNGTFLPKIGDFGLAKNYTTAGHSSMTQNGSVGGTWSYMPREQLMNFRFVSPQSDVWSLGAIAFEAMTRQVPRPIAKGQSPVEVILNHSVTPIETISDDVPQPLAAFVNQCLSDDLAIRFRDATEMREALLEVAKNLAVSLER